jgi:hypothetical protein
LRELPIIRDGRTFLNIADYARRHGISRYQAVKTWAETEGAWQNALHAYIPADAKPAAIRKHKRRRRGGEK